MAMQWPDTTAGRLRWAAIALAACAGVLALHVLAQHALRTHLRDTTAHALWRLAHDDTPYRWNFRRSETLVARRVFGVEHFEVGEKGLHFTAQETVYEVGLTLRGALDLQRFSQLEITARAERPLLVSALVVRERLDEPQRVAALPFKASGKDERIDLDTLHWTDDAGTPVAAPTRAAMLRLRAQQRAGAKFSLVSVRLLPRIGLRTVDAQQPMVLHDIGDGSDLSAPQTAWRLPAAAEAGDIVLRRFAESVPRDRLPLIALPPAQRAETALAQRDRVQAALPAALLLPADRLDDLRMAMHDAATPSSLTAEQQRWLRWGSFATFVLGLLILRRWPPKDLLWRAALEAIAAIAGPLWLVVGQQFGDNPDALAWGVIVASLLFALSLRRLDETPRWHWFGSLPAWRWPFLPLALAALLVVLLHAPAQSWTPPTPATAARYLGWAVLQQYLICAVLSERLRVLGAGAPWTVLGAAFVFALLHTPNALLMQATFIGGLVWVSCWQRDRALLPIALSHAASALLLTSALPTAILRSAEVSARFFL